MSTDFIRIIAVAALASLACASSQAQQSVGYGHSVLSCGWLEGEYDRIVSENESPVQVDKSKLTLAKVLTAPFFVVEKLMGLQFEDAEAISIRGTVSFSGDTEDIMRISRDKNCYNLTEKIVQDEKAGKRFKPAPIKSYLD